MGSDIQEANGFDAAYRDLEDRMRALAEADGDSSCPVPSRKLRYITS